MASINKVVFFFFFFKLLVSFPLIFLHFSAFFLGFGLLSLFVGTFIGLYQTDVKRLIAYSGIVVMGYMFVSLGLFSYVGFVSFLFFLSIYVVTLFGLFSIVLLIRR
jgi:NADH-quinone oxidoreductase subunit N